VSALAFLSLAAQAASSTSLPFIVIGMWILVLAIFVGFEVITKVPPTLHTPLMSGANAISGITLVGALYLAGHDYPTLAHFLGFVAIVMATVNVVGGFLVTDRMLAMFGNKRRTPEKS
jgi:NAD(P) transhydrogenase subunit alpha